jgi:hypothetical protein
MRRGDRAGAQNQGTVSNDKPGAPGADDKSQTSGGPGQTDPNAGEVQDTTINPGATYVLNPRRPDIKLTGEQVLALANRGTLFDQTQSKLQRAEDLLQQSQSRVEELEKEGAQSRAKIDDIDMQERILGHLKTLGIDPGKQQGAVGGDDDLYGAGTGGTGLPGGVTPEQLFQTIKTMTQEAVEQSVAKAEEAAEKKTASVIDERSVQQERQRRIDESVGRQYRTDLSKLRNVMPDVAESNLTDLAKLGTLASTLELEARDLYDKGSIEEADALWAKAQENREEAFTKRKSLHDQQDKVAAERERAEAIEMINAGGPPGTKPKYEDGPTRNKKIARERSAERLAEAKRREAELQKYKSP